MHNTYLSKCKDQKHQSEGSPFWASKCDEPQSDHPPHDWSPKQNWENEVGCLSSNWHDVSCPRPTAREEEVSCPLKQSRTTKARPQ
jgi:hypothetical protein